MCGEITGDEIAKTEERTEQCVDALAKVAGTKDIFAFQLIGGGKALMVMKCAIATDRPLILMIGEVVNGAADIRSEQINSGILIRPGFLDGYFLADGTPVSMPAIYDLEAGVSLYKDSQAVIRIGGIASIPFTKYEDVERLIYIVKDNILLNIESQSIYKWFVEFVTKKFSEASVRMVSP